MLQALFFISLLSIAAMLLVLFWYLDDSFEEEYAMNCKQRYNKSFDREIDCRTAVAHQDEMLFIKSYLKVKNPQNHCNMRRKDYQERKIYFFEVGIDDEDLRPTSENQNECA